MCDSQNVRRPIPYDAAWMAARIVHARHKSDGNVAGYVSLDDYSDSEGFKVFVKVARKDTPDPQNKRRRSLFGRWSALDEPGSGSDPPSADRLLNETEVIENTLLESRTPRFWSNRQRVNISDTLGLYTNIRVGWGGREEVSVVQMENGADNLLNDWNQATGNPSTLRQAVYLAPGDTVIEFEWAAHNNHNINDVTPAERGFLLRWAIQQRQQEGDHWENFAMQIRRGGESVGHLIIRTFYLGFQNALDQVCG